MMGFIRSLTLLFNIRIYKHSKSSENLSSYLKKFLVIKFDKVQKCKIIIITW